MPQEKRKTEMLKQKITAIVMIALTLPVTFLELDCTSTVLVSCLALPLFFSKEQVM